MANFSAITYALAKKYTDKLFSKVDSISISFVEQLPTSDIKEKTIYFIPRKPIIVPEDEYIYDEYMYVEGQWKQVGSTELHLEDYYTKIELQQELPNILPYATTEKTGGIKIDGKTVIINTDGILSVNFDSTEEGSVQDIVQNQIEENFNSINDDDIDNLFN